MVFFDEETEKICNELGYDLILPSAALREHLDSKIVTTQLGNEAGAPSVPNVLTSVDDWDELVDGSRRRPGSAPTWWCRRRTATRGKTTFFIDQRGRLGQARRGHRRPAGRRS